MANKPITDEPNAPDAQSDEDTASPPYKLWLRRAGATGLEIFGDLFAVLIGLLIVGAYVSNTLLIRQTTSLTALQPTVKRLMAQSFEGADATYESLNLNWYPSRDTLILTAKNMEILNRDGEIIQTLDLLEGGFHLDSVRQIKPELRSVEIVGGEVTWLEREDGTMIAGLGRPAHVGQFGPSYRGGVPSFGSNIDEPAEGDAPRQNPAWLDRFEAITIRQSRAYIINEQNGLDIIVDVDSFNGQREGEVLSLDVIAETRANQDAPSSGALRLRVRSPDALKTVSVDGTLTELRLDQVAPTQGRFSVARSFALPISVTGNGIYSQESGIDAIGVELLAGEGTVVLAGETQQVSEADFKASLDAGEEVMRVDRFTVASDLISLDGAGVIREIGRFSDGDIGTSPTFDLSFDTARLDLTPVFESALQFQSIEAVGQLDLDARRLSFERLSLRPGKANSYGLELEGTIQTAPSGLSLLRLTGRATDTMRPDDILEIWPVAFADGARRWVARSVIASDVEQLSFDVDLDADFFANPVLTPERLTVDYSISNGTVRYISTMTPLTEAFATGQFLGNTVYLDLASGQIGDVVLTEGRVDIPQLMPKGGDILISAIANADTQSLLGLVDQPPFEYLKKYGVSPEGFGGQGSLRLSVKRPLLEFFDQSRIEYSVSGNFTDASAPFELGGYSLSDADVSFEGGKDGIFMNGPANLGPWRATIGWAERYGQNGEPTRYTVTGDLDAATLDAFGVPSRQVLGGTMGVNIDATGQGINVDGATLALDLTPSDLSFGEAWSKPAGDPAQLTATLSRPENNISFDQYAINAPGLTMRGSAQFRENFALEAARLDAVSIEGLVDGKAELSRVAFEAGERFDLDIEGRFLNITDYVKNGLQSRENSVVIPIDLEAAFSQLQLADAYTIEDGIVRYVRSDTAIEQLVLTGTRPDGPLTASIVETSDGRVASLRVPDMSQALRAVYGLETTQGGTLELDADLPASGSPGATFGSVTLNDFTVKDAPFLAQLLSLASLTGLFDTLSGEGLAFDQMSTDFSLRERRLSLRDTRMSGPALGLTAEGEVDFDSRALDLEGALVPAYTANSLLSEVPLVGDLFTDKEGEGVFALTYTVGGNFDRAQIAVNPLSALTPGFLRGIFRTDREDIDPALVEDIEAVRPDPTDAESGDGPPAEN